MQMRWGRYGVKSGRLIVRSGCPLLGRRIGAIALHALGPRRSGRVRSRG
jgi:hypothetical protein